MMLNIRKVIKNVIYSIVHSMGIICGIEGYLSDYFSLTFWCYILTNPSSSEILARISLTGLRDHYLLSVIWWFSYLGYSINELVCWYSFNCDWYESVVCSADFWTLSV